VQAQCATCHKPTLLVDDPIFSEPSQNPNYRDAVFPAGQSPLSRGLDPARPITFHIRDDPPDNVISVNGAVVARLGGFKQDASGHSIIPLFGDLKRHNMGPGLAESIDEQGFGAAVWMTAELWGVGSTAPYLHDGRASTLTEAILAHDGDAAASRAAFRSLSTPDKADLIAFLNNLVLFRAPD
jgi:cytochrome c peroxidase